MSKITISLGFYLEGEHYSQMEGFLPKAEALKIPELQVENRLTKKMDQLVENRKKPSKSQQSERAESEDDAYQNEEQEMDQQPQQQNDEEDEAIIDAGDEDQSRGGSRRASSRTRNQNQIVEEIDSEDDNLMDLLDDDESDGMDEDDLDDEDLSSISRSAGPQMHRSNFKTKRQKGIKSGLVELPDRRPRKDKKDQDEATELLRRQEKERKRKQYLKKQIEAQEKATLDKILNETGRKLKMREEKENKDEKQKEDKVYRSLGQTPKTITLDSKDGIVVKLHQVSLFSPEMTSVPQIKIKPECSNCGKDSGRYKIKGTAKTACSLPCYKVLAQ